MRLTSQEQQSLTSVVSRFVQECSAELFLFGSRTDDTKRGGDIDLLLVVASGEKQSELLRDKAKILVAFEARLGERRIDLTIATEDQVATQPFLKHVRSRAISLARWE